MKAYWLTTWVKKEPAADVCGTNTSRVLILLLVMKNNWSLVAAGWIVVEDQQVVAARVSLMRSGGRTTYKYTDMNISYN